MATNLQTQADSSIPVIDIEAIGDPKLKSLHNGMFNRLDREMIAIHSNPANFQPNSDGVTKAMVFEGGAVACRYTFETKVNHTKPTPAIPSGAYWVALHKLKTGNSGICERAHLHQGPRIIDFHTDNDAAIVIKTLSQPVINGGNLQTSKVFDDKIRRDVFYTIVPPNSHIIYRMDQNTAPAFLLVGAGRAYFNSIHTNDYKEALAVNRETTDMQDQTEALEIVCTIDDGVRAQAAHLISEFRISDTSYRRKIKFADHNELVEFDGSQSQELDLQDILNCVIGRNECSIGKELILAALQRLKETHGYATVSDHQCEGGYALRGHGYIPEFENAVCDILEEALIENSSDKAMVFDKYDCTPEDALGLIANIKGVSHINQHPELFHAAKVHLSHFDDSPYHVHS